MKTKFIISLLLVGLFLCVDAHAQSKYRYSLKNTYVRGRQYKTPKIPFNLLYVSSPFSIPRNVARRYQRKVTAYYRSYGIRMVTGKFSKVTDVFPGFKKDCIPGHEDQCCQDYECIRTEMINWYFKTNELNLRLPFTTTLALAPRVVVYSKEVLGGLALSKYHNGGYSYATGASTINGKETTRQTLNAIGHEVGHTLYLEHVDSFIYNIMYKAALHVLEEFSGEFLPLLEESVDVMVKRVNKKYNASH